MRRHESGCLSNSGSQSVLRGSQEMRDQFLRGPWIHFCNGYFEVYLLLNYIFFKVIEELSFLRYRATSRKVAGSIPVSVSGFIIDIKSFRSHYGPGVDSAPNRNEYQEYFLGVKAADAYG